MKFQRRGEPGEEIPVVVVDPAGDDAGYDLRQFTSDIDGAFLASDFEARTSAAIAAGDLPLIDLAGMRFGPPLARPMAVVCIGQNYAAHAAESGSSPPTRPVIFFKHPNTIVGAFDDVRCPPDAEKLDWEVELAVVIGRRARYLASAEEALSCVAGYAVSNDVSERAYQLDFSGGQWSKGKCCETFNPLGPYLVPAGEVPDPQQLRLTSWVNDEPRQDSSTADMIFGVAEIVMQLSQYLVLEPGDVINTGTPEGVALSGRFPYLQVGDRMRIGIDGLGTQEQRVVAAPDVPATAGVAAWESSHA